ncbi:MAG: hypothetical protein L6R45_36655 [Anaerolineae bacterium]|nr:hypothetical protein [Anaerolineae bacterium]
MKSEDEKLEQLAQDLLALFEDLANERLINAKKIEKTPPGSYPYGEGMYDGLRYAAAGLESVLKRHGLFKS